MRHLYIIIASLILSLAAKAQERVVENRPYTDLRPFHLGVVVGTHLQDIEFNNLGPIEIVNEDGTVTQSLVTVDQDRWDPGFQVGVLGEARLNAHFALRVAPAMYFGTRHFTFHNFTQTTPDGKPTEQRQELKSAYVSCAFDLIFAAQRFNNHRPYITLGLNPMLNLSRRDNDYLRLSQTDLYLSAGIGCDFYLPFFKLRPELRFMYGLGNSLDTKHASRMKDPAMRPYSMAVDKARTKIIALTFYFE